MEKRANYNAYVTDNFKKFNRASWNRDTKPQKVKKIGDSLSKVGYIGSPIVVNEFMEVIDGQNRLEACKQRNVPIEYIIRPGLRMEDAIILNAEQTSWTSIDYINAYADQGNENYILIKKVIDKYSRFNINVVFDALGFSRVNSKLKNGELELPKERYEKAMDVLERLALFRRYKQYLGSALTTWLTLERLIMKKLIDEERMMLQLEKYGDSFRQKGTVEETLQAFNEIYNYRRTVKEYFVDKYRKEFDQ